MSQKHQKQAGCESTVSRATAFTSLSHHIQRKQGSSQQDPTVSVHFKMAHGVCVSTVNGFVPLTSGKLKSADRKAVLQPLCSSSCAVPAQFKWKLHLPSSFHQLQKYSRDSGSQTSWLFLSCPVLLFASINPC